MSKKPTATPVVDLPPPPPDVVEAALDQMVATGTAIVSTDVIDGGVVQSVLDPLDPLADAPRDGTIIDLSPDGERWVAARWFESRKIEVVDNRLQWVKRGRWIEASPFIARADIDFEPIAWRRHIAS